MKLLRFLAPLLLSFPIAAQTSTLPEKLVPSESTTALAKAQGATAVVLLPRGMFDNADGSYKDVDNPIGIRGGGSYYSFSTGQHSYNKAPQIESQKGVFSVGFYGLNYGMFLDLGRRKFGELSVDSPEVFAVRNYEAPSREQDIRREQVKQKFDLGGSLFRRTVPIVLGHTYVLRAISYNDKADIVTAFQVVGESPDGSIEIVWKKMVDLESPHYARFDEGELARRVREILVDPRFTNVQGKVEVDVITLTGTVDKRDLAALIQRIANLNPKKIINNLNRK